MEGEGEEDEEDAWSGREKMVVGFVGGHVSRRSKRMVARPLPASASPFPGKKYSHTFVFSCHYFVSKGMQSRDQSRFAPKLRSLHY